MSGKYHFGNDSCAHFITFSVVNWINALTRTEYNEIIVDSMKYCIDHKGLTLNAWVIMSNHIHLILQSKEGFHLSNIVRDMKKFTSKQLYNAISENSRESRREWMIWMFQRAAKRNPNNTHFQFWQQDNHPIELRTPHMLKQRLDYLHENPVRAGIVHEPYHYQYSSAIDYYTDGKGKLVIKPLIF